MRGARLPRFWRSFGESTSAKPRRIRKLRLLALSLILGLLGLSSFTFGLLDRGRREDPAARPREAAAPQANTYVYAADGHTMLTILRGSQARIVVPSPASRRG